MLDECDISIIFLSEDDGPHAFVEPIRNKDELRTLWGEFDRYTLGNLFSWIAVYVKWSTPGMETPVEEFVGAEDWVTGARWPLLKAWLDQS